jgi:hypothetical protein
MTEALVSKDTAQRIWSAHREIEVGKELLAKIRETMERAAAVTPVDRGTQERLQLSVPSSIGHRLLDVEPELAIAVIEAHIAKPGATLEKLCRALQVRLSAGITA